MSNDLPPAPPPPASPARPPQVTTAGVLLIVLGGLTLLMNGIAFAIGLSEGEFLDIEASGLFLGLTGFGVVLGALGVVSGIGVLRLVAVWRIVGIVVASIGAASALVNLIGGVGVGIAILLVVAYVNAIVLLVRNRDAFGAGVAMGGSTGGVLGLVGAGLLVIAWFVPVLGDSRLVAPRLVPFVGWFWAFLEVLVFTALAGVAGAMALAGGGARVRGLLAGAGAVATAFFLGLLVFGIDVEAVGPGTLIGLVGGIGALVGGVAARGTEPAGAQRGPLWWLALAGAGVLFLALFLPLGGLGPTAGLPRLFAPEGVPVLVWVGQLLDLLAAVVGSTVLALLALRGGPLGWFGGALAGLGISVGAVFFGYLGTGTAGIGAILGLLGSAAIAVGGFTLTAQTRPMPASAA